MSIWARIHAAKHREGTPMATRTDDIETVTAVMYGWGEGEALAREELRPYIRHLDGCWAGADAEPQNSGCNCGLRRAWRMRETAE